MTATVQFAHGSARLDPTKYLKVNDPAQEQRDDTALVVLNSPLASIQLVERLFQHAGFRICADGGANRLHDLLIEHNAGVSWATVLKKALPQAIHGDLDSLRNDVRDRYQDLGVEISVDPDQYSTDFGKSISKITANVPGIKEVLVLGSIGGRVDQGIGLLHELYREQKLRHPELRFWLFTETSVSMLLPPGTTLIHTPLKEGLIEHDIGILPLYGKAVITTKGLEWDVEDWPTEMGGNLSTSNHIVAEQISVATNHEVLFTIARASAQRLILGHY